MSGPRGPRAPADPFPQDLARYLAASTGLPQPTAVRVIADVATYFSETVEDYVRRRHAELQARQHKNDEIWPLIAAELGVRRFGAPELSERQLRRIAYSRPRARENATCAASLGTSANGTPSPSW
jgi:hypothetical protein